MESLNCQINLRNVRERTKYAYNNSLYCDVEFVVFDSKENEITVPASRYLLAVTSPVFAAMFYGELAETESTIRLPDCSKEGLQEFLRYVHSDEVNLSGSNVIDVWYIADKYILPPLVEKCKEYIENKLTPEEVFLVLPKISRVCMDKTLEQHCWELVSCETQRAVTSPYFLDISHALLCQVLRRNKLAIDEVSLFNAVDRWVSKRIKERGLAVKGKVKRKILGEETIRLIRFPLMEEKQFAKFVLPSSVLNITEVTELFQTFNSLPTTSRYFCAKKRDGKSHLMFDQRPCPAPPLLMPCSRFESVEICSFTGSLDFSIDFEVNDPIYLVGARLFGGEGGSCYEVDLSIHEMDHTSGSYDLKCHFISTFESEEDKIDDMYYGVDVYLNNAIKLSPHSQYSARFKVKGRHEVFGLEGKSKVECQDIKVTYKNPSISTNKNLFLSKGNGITEGGQIQTLILKRI